MKRLIDWHLNAWAKSEERKPLILRGARQVGKTFAVRQLSSHFESFVEINFEMIPHAASIFEKDLDPHRILLELKYLTKKEIIPGKTLLFFDEVQASPKTITALRYFYELIPSLHLIAAGSLLDFAIEKVGMPVGRVNTLYVYPLSFLEYLAASSQAPYIDGILNETELSPALHMHLLDLVKEYMAVGGMPEVVTSWSKTKDPSKCHEAQIQLIETYRQDFPKYSSKHELKYVDLLFNQIPSLIGEQFKYSAISGEYKKRELAPCLDLLQHANVVHPIFHTSGNGIPIGAEVNPEKFKMILLDIGICQAMLNLDVAEWLLLKDPELVNRGKIAEAFVGQELLCYDNPKTRHTLYFWKRDSKGALAEVDYLKAQDGAILPIEVKSGPGSTLRSMQQFLKEHDRSPYGVRFSSQNYSSYEKIASKPLYAVAVLAAKEQKEAIRSLM